MLRTRIVTAVVLLAAFLGAVFLLPPLGWAVAAAGVAALAAWEWGGLLGFGAAARVVVGGAFLAVCLLLTGLFPDAVSGEPGAAWALGRWFYPLSACFWAGVVPLWLRRRWSLGRPAVGLVVGAVVLLPTWLALTQLRALGAVGLLGIMAVVWIADIAAYFSGRAFGRRKLAPSISPGKTWEGAIGATVAVLVYGFGVIALRAPSHGFSAAIVALALVALTAVSIVGDLFESMLKRRAGIKDSSNLLPGHGGILDRIDSLTSTLPLAALAWLAATAG